MNVHQLIILALISAALAVNFVQAVVSNIPNALKSRHHFDHVPSRIYGPSAKYIVRQSRRLPVIRAQNAGPSPLENMRKILNSAGGKMQNEASQMLNSACKNVRSEVYSWMLARAEPHIIYRHHYTDNEIPNQCKSVTFRGFDFPDFVEFYLCDAQLIDERPFMTRRDLADKCRLVKLFDRSLHLIIPRLFTPKRRMISEAVSILLREMFPDLPVDATLPTAALMEAATSRYRIVAFLANYPFNEASVLYYPSFTIGADDENQFVLRTHPMDGLVSYPDLAKRLHDLQLTDRHRLVYDIKGNEGRDNIKSLISVAEISERAVLRACQTNDAESLRILLEHGAGVNYEGFRASAVMRSMYHCCEHGKLDLMTILIEYGADVNEHYGSKSPLMEAAAADQIAAAHLLIKHGADVNIKYQLRMSPLHLAASKGHAGMVAILLAAGAEVNLANSRIASPLTLATENGHSRVVELLLKYGDLLDLRRGQDETALHLACRLGNTDIVALMLRYHPLAINVLDSKGNSPLMTAARNQQFPVVKQLLTIPGIDVNHHNFCNNTALKMAVERPEERVDIVQLLLEHGANVNDIGHALAYAVQLNHIQTVQLLLDYGASPNVMHFEGDSPLLRVVKKII